MCLKKGGGNDLEEKLALEFHDQSESNAGSLGQCEPCVLMHNKCIFVASMCQGNSKAWKVSSLHVVPQGVPYVFFRAWFGKFPTRDENPGSLPPTCPCVLCLWFMTPVLLNARWQDAGSRPGSYNIANMLFFLEKRIYCFNSCTSTFLDLRKNYLLPWMDWKG